MSGSLSWTVDASPPPDLLLANIRKTVYARSLPLATRELRITRSPLDECAGLVGAAFYPRRAVLTQRARSMDRPGLARRPARPGHVRRRPNAPTPDGRPPDLFKPR